jgi:1-deoxy-D-xylulose-5-phosphate synthase
LDPAPRLVQKTEGAVKAALLKESNLFESLGIRYFARSMAMM